MDITIEQNAKTLAAQRLAKVLGYPEDAGKVLEAMDNVLTRVEREYILEHYGIGYTHSAMAALHGVRPSTVSRNIDRGKDKLLLCLIGTPAPARREPAKAPQFNTEQCKGCYHWRFLNRGIDCGRCCHCLLDTGHRKQVENGKCLSRSEEREYERDPFEIPIPQR